MPNAILERYTQLTTSSGRSEVSAVLNSIILAPPSSLDAAARGDLVKQILEDLKACGKRRLSSKDAAQALLAVKTLGRDPSGSEKAHAPDQIFILCRILFLATASGSLYLQTMMEKKYNGHYIVDIIGSKLECLIQPVTTGANLAREAMTDLLKLTFNILLYYPNMTEAEPQVERPSNSQKVLGDFWDPKLDGLLSPILRVFLTLPTTPNSPIAPPLTHVIHALIGVPVSNSLKPIWFATQPTSSARASTSSSRPSLSNTPKSPLSQSPKGAGSQPTSRSHSPSRSSPTSPKPSTLDRALSVLTRKSRSPSPVVANSTQVVNRALDLLDTALAYHFPGKTEVDDPSVREKLKAESSDTLDDLLSPLAVLITRLCAADETCRVRVRQFIVPDDLDRSASLEERPDILGRCLRLLGSVYHARLKDSIGEMLYAACDSDASTLSGYFGYGNVAGFLFNKGVMSAPPPSESGPSNPPTTTATGESINPITGTTVQPKSGIPDMTEEEKEREMEKLLVLFDRLEKTGAMPKDQNPIRKAIHEGKFANS
ncbi:hypothetical protein H1R20_g12120, partial [Candolleomyces eurysporus]